MAAAPVDLDDFLAHDVSCTRSVFEHLDEDGATALLVARFRVLLTYGWDWSSALLLAVDVEVPAHETAELAPVLPAPLVLH